MSKDQHISEEGILSNLSGLWNLLVGIKEIDKSIKGGNPFKAYNGRNMSSRIYIEESLENESVLIKVLNMLQGLYASAILALVDESKYINSLDTVSARISNISPEQATNKFISTLANLNDYVESTEVGQSSRARTGRGNSPSSTDRDDKNNRDDNSQQNKFRSRVNDDIEAKELPPLVRKFIVSLDDGLSNNSNPIEVTLFVSLYPTFMGQEDLKMILETGSSNSVSQRRIMYRSGEIRFVRDFIFNFDIFKRKRRNYLRSIESDYQRQYYKNLDEKRMKALYKTYKSAQNLKGDSTFVNVANSIIVMSMNTKNLLKVESSLDLDNARERNELYKETMSMIFVVLDSRYNKCHLYINGVNEKITFNYDQINFRFDSKNDILKILDNIKSLRDDSTISF